MSEVKLGELIAGDQERDAVHVAIEPVVAGDNLSAGQGVGLFNYTHIGREVVGVTDSLIGIVDPFLKSDVLEGQKFWMFLYPNTVTGMRHDWSHPSFEKWRPSKDAADAWMERFAEKHTAPYEGDRVYSPDELIEAAHEYLRSGDRMVQQGDESLRDDTDSREFWKYYEIITGDAVPVCVLDVVPFCCTC